jgi:hypothetical protein
MSVYRVTCTGQLYGLTIQNVIHLEATGGISGPGDIATDVQAHWLTQIRRLQVNNLSWLDIEVRDVTTVPAPAVFHGPIHDLGSTGGAEGPDSPILAGCLRLTTAVASRHGRGRVFIAGIGFRGMQFGVFTQAFLIGCEDVSAEILDWYGATGPSPLTLVVAPRANPAAFHVVNAISMRPVVSVQRRRNYGVGI